MLALGFVAGVLVLDLEVFGAEEGVELQFAELVLVDEGFEFLAEAVGGCWVSVRLFAGAGC